MVHGTVFISFFFSFIKCLFSKQSAPIALVAFVVDDPR